MKHRQESQLLTFLMAILTGNSADLSVKENESKTKQEEGQTHRERAAPIVAVERHGRNTHGAEGTAGRKWRK